MRRHCRSLVSVNFNPFHTQKRIEGRRDGWLDGSAACSETDRIVLIWRTRIINYNLKHQAFQLSPYQTRGSLAQSVFLKLFIFRPNCCSSPSSEAMWVRVSEGFRVDIVQLVNVLLTQRRLSSSPPYYYNFSQLFPEALLISIHDDPFVLVGQVASRLADVSKVFNVN